MKLAKKLLERELDRLTPMLVDKALARRQEQRPALVRALSGGKMKTYALVGGGCLVAVGVVGNLLERQRMRRAMRRELRRALEPMEKQLEDLQKQNEALRKELRELK